MGPIQRANKGYTLVEMMVVVAILALIAASVVPSLESMKESSDRRETISGIRRIAATARERSIERGSKTQISYDESAKALQIQDVDDDGSASAVASIRLRAGIEPQKFELQNKDSNETDFKLTFTPDGHCIGGGIEFQDFSILVDTNGASRFIEGVLPDPTEREWQAGDLEQRTQ